jgi:hypothetical protein
LTFLLFSLCPPVKQQRRLGLPPSDFAPSSFQFLSPLHSPPINSLGRSGQAVDYRLVVIELDDMEAEAANWRAGFYKIAFSPVEVVGKLGEPNAALNS